MLRLGLPLVNQLLVLMSVINDKFALIHHLIMLGLNLVEVVSFLIVALPAERRVWALMTIGIGHQTV